MKNVLIVDDKKNVQITLSIGLRREGFRVETAGCAGEAMAKLQKKHYDVLVTDIRMPDTNGIDLAEKVTQLYPEMQTILMSAYDFKDYEREYHNLYRYPKISKPFAISDLLTLIHRPIIQPDFNPVAHGVVETVHFI